MLRNAVTPGSTVRLTYSLTVHSTVPTGTELANTAVPGQYGRCATEDGCTTTTPVQVRQYTVEKTVPPTQATPGTTVTYSVTVTNTGNAPYTAAGPASFSDDLSDVLDDATYNNDATGGATLTGTRLDWSGPLAVGAQTTITYSVTVNDPGTGDRRLRNAVTPGTDGRCVAAGRCATDVPVPVTPHRRSRPSRW